ncbi:hypothetical protein LPJ76_000644 [Coemansia sp. RSA 638]|nr:hypothetical protein LPJ76_000644 [Coemansia sp. RSA 638]
MDTQTFVLPNNRRRQPSRRILQSRRRQNGKSRRHYQPPPLPIHETETASKSLARVPPEPSVLHSFTDSRFPGKQDIAMLLVLRRWHEMAVASAERREQLVQMWRSAFVFRRKALVSQALSVWREQTERCTQSPNQYEKVQIQLAAMHYRQVVLRRTLDRLLQAKELVHREAFFYENSKLRLLEGCWRVWASRVHNVERAARVVEHNQRRNVLVGALTLWRNQTYDLYVGRIADDAYRTRAISQSLRVWRTQVAAHRFAQKKETSPVKQSLERWRGAADEQRRQRKLEEASVAIHTHQRRTIIDQWRSALRALAEREDEADEYYEQTLVCTVLDRLPAGALSIQKSIYTADRYHRFMCMESAVQRWRQLVRMRRSGIQQSRALREWARRRDHQRRRMVLMAWHKVAHARGRINELRVSSWMASATDADLESDLANIGPGFVDAQTMTSFQNDMPVCDRGISIQSDSLGASVAGAQSDDVEKTELAVRARRAEETAERYRTMLAAAADRVTSVEQSAAAEQDRHYRRNSIVERSKHSATLEKSTLRQMNNLEQNVQQQHTVDIVAQYQQDELMRNVLHEWRQVAQTHVHQAAQADTFYRQRVRPAALQPCRKSVVHWRQQQTTVRHLHMAADKMCWVRVAGQFLGALGARVRESQALVADADALWRTMLLLRVWNKLFEAASTRLAERSRRSIAPDEGPAQREEMDVILAQVDVEELGVYFGAWRDVMQETREVQADVADRLPRRLQVLAYSSADGQFAWEVVHMEKLVRGALGRWRQRLQTARTVLPRQNEALQSRATQLELQKSETLFKQGAQRKILHRWMVAVRGRLLESRRVAQTLEHAVHTIAQRGRQVQAAQTTAAEFLLQPKLNHWWRRYYVYNSRLDNADTQANGTLLRLCLLHWVAQIRQHRAPDRGRQLYTTAVAFRWEKQARRTLLAWMRASSDSRVRVRLAQRTSGVEREQQLEEAAELWAQKRAKQGALRKVARAARVRALQRDISMRFATAWGNANVQRHALATWRMRVSPSSSMFFSVVGS